MRWPQTLAERHPLRLAVVGLVIAAAVGAVSWSAPAPRRVLAAPEADVTQAIAAQTLVGRETGVEVTFRNTGDTTAYNLALVVRLPVGVSVSSADRPPSDVIVETDTTGTPIGSVVAWENIVDVRPDGVFRFRYSLAHVVGTGDGQWTVGQTIDTVVEAYVNDVDAVRPRVETVTTGAQVTAEVVDFTQSGDAPGSTTLVPLLLSKSEPSVEGELLRGVHDHQTVYTITAETGSLPGVAVSTLEDWIPAGLEFLGCGLIDNSSGEEYPGSGPLNPGNAPALEGPCLPPSVVETVSTGLPSGLPAGVYTHVVWDISTTPFPPSTVLELSYVAGIPQRENTTTWLPGAAPAPGSGLQGANLDNNSGPLTTQLGDGATWTNLVTADTTFEGIPTPVEATESVQAVDVSVHKFVSDPVIQQGAVSSWILLVETSEYVIEGGVAGLALTDVTPDGTCPIGSVNPRCTVSVPPPTPPYTSSSYDAGSGETTLVWDLGTETLGRSQRLFVGFATEALPTYVVGGGPVSANDSWTNRVDLDADATTYGPGGPDDAAGLATNDVTDDSSREQSGTPVSFRKDVGRPDVGAACGDGTSIAWSADALADIGPGDRVCFRLTADPPDALDTLEVFLVDFLPIGFRFEEDSEVAGPDNEVPVEDVIGALVSGTPETGQRLDWTLEPPTFLAPAQVAQVVFSAVVDGASPPDLATSGDEIVNSARFAYENTSGEIFVVPGDASVVFSEAHLALRKGILAVDGATFTPPIDSASNVDGASAVTYAVDVTNDGTRDAFGVEVVDRLAINGDGIGGEDATCAQITAISPGGACAGDDVTWTGLAIPAGETIRLTYTWTLPAVVPVATSWRNEAGVVEYRSTTTTGTDFVYVPRNNIDPVREPEANTDPARDDAQLFSPGLALSKTRTTAIAEPGNAAADQATIGEVISFTVEARQSAGTIITDATLTDDLRGRGLTLVAGSAEARSAPVSPGAACDVSGAPPLPAFPAIPGIRVTGDLIEVIGPAGDLATSTDDLCVVLTFRAVVQDAPDDAGEALVRRPGVVTNEAIVTFDADPGAPVAPRTVRARVDTQVVEPNLSIDKEAASNDTVFPGAVVPYRLIVTNRSAAQVATAHDLVVTDDFSASTVGAVVDNPDGGVVAGTTITWTLPADPDGDGVAGLSPGASVVLAYAVTLQSPLVAGDLLTNTATVVGASLPAAAPGARTAASACSPAECPGYVDDDSVTLEVDGPRVEKTPILPLDTIGGLQGYLVQAILPANLDFGPAVVTLTDDLAVGATTYVETVSMVCLGCTDAERALFERPEENDTAGTDAPRWDLAVFGPSTTTRRVFVVYRTRVEDAPTLGAGDTLTNTVTLDYINDSLDADATIEIAEPAVSIVKRVAGVILDSGLRETTPADPVIGAPGAPITYELQITNSGGWTAYDIAVTDEPDSLSSGGSCTGDARLLADGITGAPGAELVDDTLGPGDACLGWTVPVLFPGRTVSILYQLRVPEDFPRDDLIIGSEFVNVATVPEYFGPFATERAGNPDVHDYPATPLTDEGYVDLAGGVLGDLVWLDVDGDGLGPDTLGTGDPGEPGIPAVGVDVSLGADPPLDHITDGAGRWLTDDGTPTWLPVGTYTITVAIADLPAGLANSADPDGGNDSTATIALGENAVDLTQDFGYAGRGSVGDRVWLDLDGNGEPDSGEPGIPGVGLDVTWAGFDGELGTDDDVDYGHATTDAAGIYGVGFLPAGPVRVDVDTSTLPPGVVATYDLDGGDDSTADRPLGVAENATDVDFAYTGTAAVGDLVWLDRDGDGLVDPFEPGLPGILVTVTWAGVDETLGTADDVVYDSVGTDTDGGYLVGNIPAGDVLVAIDAAALPAGLVQTFDADGVLDGQTVRTLTIGEDRDADFGYRGANAIGDLVWLDVAADGFGPDSPPPDDQDDPGVPGQPLVVRWAGADDLLDTLDDVVLAPTLTNTAGRWGVDSVPDGPVRVSLVGGPATDLDVTADPDGTLDGVSVRTIAGDDLDIDFGLAGSASVGDLVWFDADGDGVVDAGEPGIPDVDVAVTWAGFDGTLGTADDVDYGIATTDAGGGYGVGNLPPGPVRVTVDPDTLPVGLTASFDLDGGADGTADRELAVGAAATDVDFGYVGAGVAGDFVWWDFDGDGVQDPGEPGFPGVGVTLTWAGFDGTAGTADDVVRTTATGGDGRYGFDLLAPGDFVVAVDTADLPAGLTPTADPDGAADSTAAFALGVAGSNLDLDFGYVGRRSIGDLVWSDINRDGARQPAEPAIGAARLTITFLGVDAIAGTADDISFVVQTAVATPTGPAGFAGFRAPAAPAPQQVATGGEPLPGDPFYDARGLVDGSYVVVLDAASLPAGYVPFGDRDGGDPARSAVVLAGADVDDADFAVFRDDPPSVGGQSGTAACGSDLVVDPLAGVTDPNGGVLTYVAGSAVAPAGVTVTVTADGRLRITSATSVTEDYVVTWQVADDLGARTTVSLAVDVHCIDVEAGTACSGGDPYLWWRIEGVGRVAQAPVTVTWYDEAGTVRSTSTDQPLVGSAWWPAGAATGDRIHARLRTADGATSGTFTFTENCDGVLASTGAQILRAIAVALLSILAGAAALLLARRRRSA